jgi:hypothetical protein
MNHPSLSAQQIYDTAPLGSLISFSDGTPEPPARHRRKHAAWESSNGTGRLTRKVPANRASAASFTLHLADFGSGDVTVVKAYRTVPVTSWGMTMSFGTYLRLDITVHDGWRAVVRAAARKLRPEARRDPARREARHRFYGQMLEYHRGAQEIVAYWRL